MALGSSLAYGTVGVVAGADTAVDGRSEDTTVDGRSEDNTEDSTEDDAGAPLHRVKKRATREKEVRTGVRIVTVAPGTGDVGFE